MIFNLADNISKKSGNSLDTLLFTYRILKQVRSFQNWGRAKNALFKQLFLISIEVTIIIGRN